MKIAARCLVMLSLLRVRMKVRATLAALGATLLLGLLAPPVEAAVPRIPITCGMVVIQDAYLYLEQDLDCSTSVGVDVALRPRARGHSAGHRGPQGTYAPWARRGAWGHGVQLPGRVRIASACSTGRSKTGGWASAVTTNTRATNLRLVGNRYGFFCNGNCTADRIAFEGSDTGMNVGAEAFGVVRWSTFSGNQTGASVYDLSGLRIQRSKFVRNDVGVLSIGARVKVSFSGFRRNGTAILVDNWRRKWLRRPVPGGLPEQRPRPRRTDLLISTATITRLHVP